MSKKVFYDSSITTTNKVFFDPCGDQLGLMIHDNVLSNGRGHYGGKTLEEYRQTNPLMMIVDWEQANKWIEDYYTSEPQEIESDRFFDMLECLPPIDWRNHSGGESFKMSERLTGNITAIYARIGDRYFTMNNNIKTTHGAIMAIIRQSAAFKAKQ